MGQSRIENPFTLIRRYSSKRHLSFLDYHMKLSHCHVDVTETILGTDLHIHSIHIHLIGEPRFK